MTEDQRLPEIGAPPIADVDGPTEYERSIVGYRYAGAVYCPLDLVMHLAATGFLTVDIYDGERLEEVLHRQAQALGQAYDRSTFPSPITIADADASDFCTACDRILNEQPQRFADNA